MLKRVLPLVVITAAACAATALAQSDGPSEGARRRFEQQLVGQTVTLRVPLYSVLSTSTTTDVLARTRDGRVITGTNETDAEQDGVTALSPDVGVFFTHLDFSNGIQEVTDADIDRFMTRLNGMRGRVSPAQLVTYKAGTVLRVRGIEWNRRLVMLTFDDPVALQGTLPPEDPATSLRIQWPTDLSAGFDEQSRVEELLNAVFARE